MARKLNRDGSFFAQDAKHTGQEPKWDEWEDLSAWAFIDKKRSALNFYAYYCDFDDLKKDFYEYAETMFSKQEIKIFKRYYKRAGSSVLTCAKIARMIKMGMPIEHPWVFEHKNDTTVRFKETVARAISDCRYYALWEKPTEDEKDVDKPKVISPTKRLENKCNEKVISFLEEAVDGIINNDEYQEINIQELLGHGEIPAKGCELIIKALSSELDLYQEIKLGNDEQLTEAYSFLPKRELNKVIKLLKEWIMDIEKYRQSVKKTKVRVKKVQPAGTQVKDINYDKDGSIVSAVKIPGAVELIIFNSKYRKLQVYYAIGRSGLSVKGTTIKDFDDVKSYQFTVRKASIHTFVGKDPKAIEKNLSDKVKRTKVNGRVNEHCRIVYVK